MLIIAITLHEPVFLNLLRSPGIDSQPVGIDFLSPYRFTNTGSEFTYGTCRGLDLNTVRSHANFFAVRKQSLQNSELLLLQR